MAKRSTGDAGFDAFWSVYPRRVGKISAMKAWAKSVKIADEQEILQAAREFAVSDVGLGDFCPHPATWLNAGRWDDDRSAWYERKLSGKNRSAIAARDEILKELDDPFGG